MCESTASLMAVKHVRLYIWITETTVINITINTVLIDLNTNTIPSILIDKTAPQPKTNNFLALQSYWVIQHTNSLLFCSEAFFRNYT